MSLSFDSSKMRGVKRKVSSRSEQLMMEKLMDLIERHYKENRSPGFYAGLLHMTLWRINKLAVFYYQKTLYQLVQDRIQQEVESLLKHSMLNCKEIAFELGVCDPAHFSRCFKQLTGMSPLEYRRKHNV